MRTLYMFIVVLGFFIVIPSFYVIAQVGINTNNSPPDPSAGLDINFTNKGLLLPRMNFEQRNAILNPAEGLWVFCTNCNQDGSGTMSVFQNGQWINVAGSCVVPAPPPAGSHVPSVTSMIWKWNQVPIANGYKWNTTNDYASAIDMGTDTLKTETGLTCWTTYNRYVWAYNVCGNSSVASLSNTTSIIPFSLAPAPGVHVAGAHKIIWNWNPVAGALGYKWNTTDNFNSATDMAILTTKTETGLACDSAFTRFVWSYDECGNSLPVPLTQSTAGPCYSIGQSYGGGIIFYIDQTDYHGLISATSDQSDGAEWGCSGTSIPGTLAYVGTGQANTTAIVNGCSTPGIAARICNDLVLNDYSDWFLPAYDEMLEMYANRMIIGGFSPVPYWTSYQYNSMPTTSAYYFSFATGTGSGFGSSKSTPRRVRAIRAF